MRTVWVNDNGDQFDSYEEAYDDSYQKMSWDDLANLFYSRVSLVEFLKWASKQDNFWTDYEYDMHQAEEDYFTDHYWKEEVKDEEE